jgi:hypothetical protein
LSARTADPLTVKMALPQSILTCHAFA